MNMTTHSKATLEIVIHNTEVSDAIDAYWSVRPPNDWK
jgi:hypothetical protein